MASAASARTPACQIYVMLDAGPGALDLLTTLLGRTPLASVTIVPLAAQPLTAAAVRPLVDLAQRRHCALLLQDNAPLARTLRADGVHLSAGPELVARYDEARSILGQGAIIGVDVGRSRHRAMELGEAGADYIGFSDTEIIDAHPIPDAADTDVDEDLGPKALDDLIAWWSEIFEPPCVALGGEDEATWRKMAAAGADFVAVSLGGGRVHADAVKTLTQVRQILEGVDAG